MARLLLYYPQRDFRELRKRRLNMKIYQKLGMTLLAVAGLTACGSSTSAPATINSASTACVPTSVATCVNGVLTPINGTGNSYPITVNGVPGTETVTQVFNNINYYNSQWLYQTTITGSTFSENVTVSAGDRVLVELNGSFEETTGSLWGVINTYSTSSLSSFRLLVNGQPIGNGTVSENDLVQAGGTLTFSSGTATSGTTYVGIPSNDNVYIHHCTGNDGSLMTCPN